MIFLKKLKKEDSWEPLAKEMKKKFNDLFYQINEIINSFIFLKKIHNLFFFKNIFIFILINIVVTIIM